MCRSRFNVAMLNMDFSTHSLQALDMQIHWAGANRTAARQGNTGMTETRKQRAQHKNRSTHGFHHLVRRLMRSNIAGIQSDAIVTMICDYNAHVRQQLLGCAYITQYGYVAKLEWRLCQQCCT